MADAKLDGWLNKVEEAVLSHQTARLQRWAERQRQALQRAVKVEQAVCANNSSITDGVITGVQDELQQRDAAAHQGREGRMRPTLSAGAATYATGAENHGQRAVGKAVHAVGGCL